MEVSYYTEERLKLAEKKFLELADDRFISLENFQILIKARNVSNEYILLFATYI